MMSQNYNDTATLIAALEWHIDHGADEMLLDEPVDRTVVPKISSISENIAKAETISQVSEKPSPKILNFQDSAPQEDMMGAAEAVLQAQKIANSCDNLDDLRQAISDFEGLSLKKTASNMVFSDGNLNSDVMVIGEAPEGHDDVIGKPFMDESGKLLDRILACISLDRSSEEVKSAVYLTNVLNWRPPGNRTPTRAEMDVSRPFIEKHIALVKPKALIILGGSAAQMLLSSSDTISKLRGKFHDYKISEGLTIPAIVTYQPAYLLRTPAQKKAVWSDMLMFQEKLRNL